MSDAPTSHVADGHDWRAMFSVAAEQIYRDGGFYDGEVPLPSLLDLAGACNGAVQVVAELFPPSPVTRPMPDLLAGSDEAFIRLIQDNYRHFNDFFSKIAASVLVRIRQAAIYDNVVFVVHNGTLIPVYEMLRTVDRPVKGREMAVRASRKGESRSIDPDGNAFLFIGSVGSSNYGHWLIDDLPTIKAMEFIAEETPITALMSSLGDRIDAVRADGVALGRSQPGMVKPMFLPVEDLVFVDNLYYATPVSYHPILKHPQALAHLLAICNERFGASSLREDRRRLFVNRSTSHPRHITNNDAVKFILAEYGFEEIFPEGLSFSQQRQAFHEASHVVGIMGAAMTNTVFCPPDGHILHLAPNGWGEPFYWDLAAMRGQSYNAFFGVPQGNIDQVHQCSFEVNIDQLRAWLERVVPKPA
ncbi:glycosyltransferase family 61 protein [Azospirillum isscasi]|uniref:Glycosyltransferase family 61 protein n=1 Tax=Azospirillum isscasi TaxID=3053926 RepID=A0ABU0WD26_9PROT|nr:glycosyltransferase family 61 protein [Azospirillum isscasi]MDQ2102085.1 glycosyltransferase family 61 protein [Azospirillum isscasi]